MEAREIFLTRHASVHSHRMHAEGWWHEEDMLLADLTEANIRRRPTAAHNSIIWLLWHIARCEDVAVNTVLRAEPEVLDGDGWIERLRIDSRHIGTDATAAEVNAISMTIDLAALRAYRAAVGRRTRAWATGLDFDTLRSVVSADDARRAAARGAFGPDAGWVLEHWGGRGWPRIEFLFWLAIEHTWYHIGEIRVIRNLLRIETER